MKSEYTQVFLDINRTIAFIKVQDPPLEENKWHYIKEDLVATADILVNGCSKNLFILKEFLGESDLEYRKISNKVNNELLDLLQKTADASISKLETNQFEKILKFQDYYYRSVDLLKKMETSYCDDITQERKNKLIAILKRIHVLINDFGMRDINYQSFSNRNTTINDLPKLNKNSELGDKIGCGIWFIILLGICIFWFGVSNEIRYAHNMSSFGFLVTFIVLAIIFIAVQTIRNK